MPLSSRTKYADGSSRIPALLLAAVLTGCAAIPPQSPLSFLRPVEIEWQDTAWCLPLGIKSTLNRISKRFGKLRVHSTHRWPLENRRKGGKPKSYHLTCRAVDFSIDGDENPQEVINFLKSRWEVGGYSYYHGRGFYHIDNGPRRTW